MAEFSNLLGYDVKDKQARFDIEKNSLKGKYIFIGDSYAKTTTERTVTWMEYLVTKLGLSDGDYYKSANHGAGFAHSNESGKTFLATLEDLSSTITNKEEITKIIVCGGFNDKGYSIAHIRTPFIAFNDYVKANYPNAKLYVGMIGNAMLTSNFNNVLKFYRNVGSYGAYYLNGVEYALCDSGYFLSDNFHPNNNGGENIATAIFSALATGQFCYNSAYLCKAIVEGGSNLEFNFTQQMNNDICQIWGMIDRFALGTNTINIVPDGNTKNKIATLQTPYIFMGKSELNIPCYVTMQNTSGVFTCTPATLLLSGGVFYLTLAIMNDAGSNFKDAFDIKYLNIHPFNATFPTVYA